MCVIVMKNPEVRLETAHIQKMWADNKDGAGVMYIHPETRKLIVHKGLMSLDSLLEVVEPLQDRQLFIHFRLATHGPPIPELTHPFGLVPDVDKSILCEATEAIMHNGMIYGYGSREEKEGAISDSLDFTVNVLSHMKDNAERARLLRDQIKGKYAILSENNGGVYRLVGDFQEKYGLMCSNLLWDTCYTRHYRGNQSCMGVSNRSMYDDYNIGDGNGYDSMYEASDDIPKCGFHGQRLSRKERKRLARINAAVTNPRKRYTPEDGWKGGEPRSRDMQEHVDAVVKSNLPLLPAPPQEAIGTVKMKDGVWRQVDSGLITDLNSDVPIEGEPLDPPPQQTRPPLRLLLSGDGKFHVPVNGNNNGHHKNGYPPSGNA